MRTLTPTDIVVARKKLRNAWEQHNDLGITTSVRGGMMFVGWRHYVLDAAGPIGVWQSTQSVAVLQVLLADLQAMRNPQTITQPVEVVIPERRPVIIPARRRKRATKRRVKIERIRPVSSRRTGPRARWGRITRELCDLGKY